MVSETTKREQRAGRMMSMKTQGEALCKLVMVKYDLPRPCNLLLNDSEDPKDWTVRYVGDKMATECSWQSFPSKEFIAQLILLGDIK